MFDEDQGTYRPRWGYQASSLEDQPIVEVKEGADPFADPWTEDKKKKKERVEKNEKNMMRNLKRAGKGAKKEAEKKGFGEFTILLCLYQSYMAAALSYCLFCVYAFSYIFSSLA
ncbi:hypothetical protein EON65_01845 [archaeon]|nr:MAG: hypothetical protein EON65_01845 [archaeon]